jgi:hypothetical protein
MSGFNTIKEGDTFEAVSDGKGGFNFKPKGGSDGSGGGLFFLAFILLALLIAVICLPLVLALYALMLDDYSARKTRKLALIISVVLILAYFIGQQIESVKPIFEVIVSYKRLFKMALILNTFGVLSAAVGLIKGIPNKFNAIFTIVAVVTFLGGAIYKFGGNLFDKSPGADYTKEQLNQACECYENSYSYKPIPFDNMSLRDQQKRRNCFELFKPKDYEIGDNVDTLMRLACDQQSSK